MHAVVLKSRPDLIWQAQPGGWLVYDPLARGGFRCGDVEHWLMEQFDGQRSLAEIHQDAHKTVTPNGSSQRGSTQHNSTQNAANQNASIHLISWQELVALANTLIQRGLVRPVGPADVSSLTSRPRRTWLQWFSQSVSWRMRGVNPQRLLQWLAPHTDMFFSAIAVRCWLSLMTMVACLVLADFHRLIEQADLWQWLMKPASGSTLLLIFLVTRGIHELGHALVLTRFGGRSPDIGLIFMLGAPCVYCDVTESWRLPHAWQRAAVAAGGMLAESIVATLAGLVWLVTVDGPVNTLALQTMFVCSVSTWLVNANPLMRFDGYYILSDWCDEPNLRMRADQCALHLVKRLTLGIRETITPRITTQRFLALTLFSILGCVYRISLSWMMASVIVAMYAGWHFESMGKWIAVTLLVCWWGVPAMKLIRQLVGSARSMWSRARLGILVAWIVLLACIVPIPDRQTGTGWVQPLRMQGLYAPQQARLESIHKYAGDRVEAGDIVFQMDDASAQLRRIELEHHARRAEVQLVSLRYQLKRNHPIDMDLRAAESLARSAANQAQHASDATLKHQVRAEMAGKLVSWPAPTVIGLDGQELVPAPELWLDPDQCGRMVPQGTMIGAICSRELLAIIPVRDSQLREIGEGTAVNFFLRSHSQRVWAGKVKAVVRLEQLDSLSRLMVAGSTPAKADGTTSPAAEKDRAGYAAVVELPMQDASIGSEVRAVFTVPPKTIASRLNDWAHENVRWLINN